MSNLDKHLKTKLNFDLIDVGYNFAADIELDTLRIIWSHWTDNQRLEVIKSLIWTAPDSHTMKNKVWKMIEKLDVD